MTAPGFNDLTPPHDMAPVWPPMHFSRDDVIAATRWGARHGYEQARQLWPEPITDRPPTEADGDGYEDVQVLTGAGRWKLCHWSAVNGDPWMHSPNWQPRQPTLKEQALEDLEKIERALLQMGFIEKTETTLQGLVSNVRRALEQAGEGVEE